MTFFSKILNYFTIPTFIPMTERELDMRATIINLDNNRFGLATSEGIVGSYSRARDARRGAERLGLLLV